MNQSDPFKVIFGVLVFMACLMFILMSVDAGEVEHAVIFALIALLSLGMFVKDLALLLSCKKAKEAQEKLDKEENREAVSS